MTRKRFGGSADDGAGRGVTSGKLTPAANNSIRARARAPLGRFCGSPFSRLTTVRLSAFAR
jgi:hypothetical protein